MRLAIFFRGYSSFFYYVYFLLILFNKSLAVSTDFHDKPVADEAPSTPTGLVVYGKSSSSFTITWNEVSGATNYKVYVSDDEGDGWSKTSYPTSNSYTVTGYEDWYEYFFIYVYAQDASGTSGSAYVSLDLGTSTPSTPSGLTSSNVSSSGFTAKWNSVSGATAYIVDVSTKSDFSTKVSGYDHKQTSATSMSVTGLSVGTTYYYRVRSVKSGIGSNAVSNSVLTSPGKPEALAATSVTSNSFVANWETASGSVSNYILYVWEESDGWSRTYELSSSTRQYQLTGLEEDWYYFYQVKAVNSGGESGWSNQVVVDLEKGVPDPPVALVPTAIYDTYFIARWESVSDADYYQLDLAYDNGFTNNIYQNNQVNGTSLTISTSPNTTYFYRVRAYIDDPNYGGDVQTGESQIIEVKTAPAKPSISVSDISSSSFTLDWNAVSGATSYRIEAWDDTDGWTQTKETSNSEVTFDNLDNDILYFSFRARSSNGEHNSLYTSTQEVVLKPVEPQVLAVSNVSAYQFTANWSSVSDARYYEIDVSTDPNFSNYVYYGDGEDFYDFLVEGTSYAVGSNLNLTPETTYYYRVRAYHDGGYSGESEVMEVTTTPIPPDTPEALAATYITSTSFKANWTEVSGTLDHYELYVWEESDGWSRTYTINAGILEYAISGLEEDWYYFYKVKAVNSGGASGWSNDVVADLGRGNPDPPIALEPTTVYDEYFTAIWEGVPDATYYQLDVAYNDDFTNSIYQNFRVDGTSQVIITNPNTTYYYRVRAYIEDPNYVDDIQTEESEEIVVKTAPARPSITVSDISSSSFTLDWNAVSGATSYRIEAWDDTDGWSQTKETSNSEVTFDNLDNGILYFSFRARSSNGEHNSLYTSTQEVILRPTEPEILKASEVGAYQFTANWKNVSDARYYELDVSTDPNFSNYVYYGDGEDFYDFLVEGTSYAVGSNLNLTPETTYYYRVRAYHDGGYSGESEVMEVTTTPIPPDAPEALLATNVTSTSFKANWTEVSGTLDHYELYVWEESDGWSRTYTINAGILEYAISGLEEDWYYFYKVKAVNSGGESDWSNTIYIDLEKGNPAPPVILEASNVDATNFTANWESVTYATHYELDVALDNDFTNYLNNGSGYYQDFIVNDISQLIGGDYQLQENTTYYYRVRANIDNPNYVDDIYTNESEVMMVTTLSYIDVMDASHNYVSSEIPRIQMGSSDMADATYEEKLVTYNFYDELGRPTQTMRWRASPELLNMASGVSYDDFGRQVKTYLSYPSESFYDETMEHNQRTFYDASYEGGNEGAYAYTKTEYESSPLNRVLSQYGPGSNWSEKPNRRKYLLNESDTEVILWDHVGLLSQELTYYSKGQLYKNILTDEEGHESIEYTNERGQTILKKSYEGVKENKWAETYYVYDDFDQLRVVLPPQAVDLLTSEFFGKSETVRQDFLDNWAFQYEYDYRQRMITKKVPGAGSVYMIYDKWDRLVLTQDGNQRKENEFKWTFTKYDVYNRPVLTGVTVSDEFTREDLQVLAMENSSRYVSESSFNEFGYAVEEAFPSFETEGDFIDFRILTVTFYDDYDFNGAISDISYIRPDELSASDDFHLLPMELSSSVKGQVTATKTNILGTEDFLETITFYDDKYRVIQVVSENEVGGTDVISSQYDFVGNVRRVKSMHTDDAIGETTVLLEYDYDHANRLLSCDHQLKDSPKVRLYTNEYNELGELIDKKLHSLDGGNTYSQSVDYEYNIRGWLTKINEASVEGTTESPEITLPDVFGMELYYEMTPDLN